MCPLSEIRHSKQPPARVHKDVYGLTPKSTNGYVILPRLPQMWKDDNARERGKGRRRGFTHPGQSAWDHSSLVRSRSRHHNCPWAGWFRADSIQNLSVRNLPDRRIRHHRCGLVSSDPGNRRGSRLTEERKCEVLPDPPAIDPLLYWPRLRNWRGIQQPGDAGECSELLRALPGTDDWRHYPVARGHHLLRAQRRTKAELEGSPNLRGRNVDIPSCLCRDVGVSNNASNQHRQPCGRLLRGFAYGILVSEVP
jgi:hypothetical protein